MNWETILALLIGGSGLGGWISSILSRRSQKESNDIDLLDRAYTEITRLDEIIDELKKELRNERGDKRELKRIIDKLETKVQELKNEIDEYERQLDERERGEN